MYDDTEPTAMPPDRLRPVWRTVTWAGLFGSLYYILCVVGTPRIKFLTELDATAFHFGLIAGLGSLLIAFQIVGSMLANKIARRKPVWMGMMITHRLIFLGVIAAPFLFEDSELRLTFIIATIFMHDLVAQTGLPLWLSWMADLVPRRSLNRHWASRQRFITAINIFAMILLAFVFHYFEQSGRIVEGYCLLAAVGVALGVADILMFVRVPEPVAARVDFGGWRETLTQPLRDPKFRPYVYFFGYWQFSVFLAAPFFDLFLIGFMGYNVWTVQLMGAAGAIGVTLASRFWGLVCDTYGFRPTLQMLAVAKSLTPIPFILAPQLPSVAIPMLACSIFLDGMMNAGLALATQGVLLKSTPRKNRTMYIAAVNFISLGMMAGIAPMISGRTIDVLNESFHVYAGPYHFTGFHVIFLISVVMRLASVLFARRICEERSVPVRTVLSQLRSWKLFKIIRLVNRLGDSTEPEVRRATARQLGELRSPMAIAELTHALEDPTQLVREAAADALGKIGVADATEPLARALFNAQSGIRSSAARALGQIGGVDSLKVLLSSLRQLDQESLLDAIDSLARIRHDAAILPLICLFHENQEPAVRNRIAEALAQLSAVDSEAEVVNLLMARRPVDQMEIR